MVFQLYYIVPVQKFENKVLNMVCCLKVFPALSARAQSQRIESWGQDPILGPITGFWGPIDCKSLYVFELFTGVDAQR